ncbi:hypothetical protein AA0120_g2641 [Alternaria tenuissima]|nr:hypothetical protein AA0120_g2641 [Alternaria tenuissima]
MRNHSVIVVPAWSTRRGFAKFTYQGPIPDPENGILAAEDHEADFDRHISSSIVVFDHGVSTALRNHIGEKDHAVMLLSLAGFESLDDQRNSYASLSATSKLEGRNQMRSSEEASAGTQQGWISKQTRQPHFRIDDNGSQFQMHWTPESGTRGYYHLDYLGESTVYNTLKWDQEQYMYIYRDSDGTRAYWNGTWFSKTKPSTEHEDAYIKSTSGQGQDSHSLDSTAISQAGDRSSPILDAMSSKLRATWLEALEGDAANTRAGIQPFSSRFAGSALTPDHSQDTNLVSGTVNSDTKELSHHMSSETISLHDWKEVRSKLPVDWQFDVEYHVIKVNKGGQHGCWTCTPLELNEPKCYPLTIAGAPVILPVDYRWPPESGLMPPPDPRATMPIDCRATLPLALVKDLFLTFQGSIGFYVLINGLLQVIVPKDYDTSWASSHLPHKYGGLKVCYIERNLEPTMLPSATDTSRATTSGSPVGPHGISGSFRPASLSAQSVTRYPSLKLDDFIEARPLSNHTRDRFSGRVGLRVARAGVEPLVVMSTHVITEAILAKSRRDTIFGRSLDDRLRKLEDDWNDHVEIWAGDRKVGTIDSTFDIDAEFYPVGFNHDITLIKPSSPAVVQGIASPIANLGWLHQNSWSLLRQQTSTVEILADTEISQSGRSIRCSRPSDVLVVGEGIFLNQKAAAGSSKSLKDHDASTWNDLVSRALLYRVYPDFDPPNGHSGTALYADGVREDGTEGPGIAGFQSFVQRSGHVQNFEMEGPALERRLQLGRVAFYGAFEVPSELKQYDIV